MGGPTGSDDVTRGAVEGSPLVRRVGLLEIETAHSDRRYVAKGIVGGIGDLFLVQRFLCRYL